MLKRKLLFISSGDRSKSQIYVWQHCRFYPQLVPRGGRSSNKFKKIEVLNTIFTINASKICSVMSILVIDMHIVKVYRSEVRYWIHKWYYYLTLDKGF